MNPPPALLDEERRRRRPQTPPSGQPLGPRRPTGPPPEVLARRAITLLLLTLVAPGSAQLAAGSRRAGRLALLVWVAVLGGLLLIGGLWLGSERAALSVLTNTWFLYLAGALLLLGGLVWPALVIDAWRLGSVPGVPVRPRRWVAALAVIAVLLTSLPLLAAGRRAWAAGDLIANVFSSHHRSAAVQGRFNVLLLGGDAGADRVGLRPDSMTLVSVNATTGRSVLFSLPRNLEDIPFPAGTPAAKALPAGWSCGDNCLLNGLYTWGVAHAALFPGAMDPGAAAMKQAVQGVTGLPVNYFVLIDLRGFSQLIDAMGGIRVTVRTPVPIGGGTSRVSGYIKPGTRRLDGYHALWYARSRHGANDYERMARQRCVMNAMLNQLDPSTVLAKFQGIAAAGKQVVKTDIPAADLATFINLATKARAQQVTSVQFVPPLVIPAHPDISKIRSTVVSSLLASERAPNSEPSAKKAGSGAAATGPATPAASPARTADPAAGTDIRQVCAPA